MAAAHGPVSELEALTAGRSQRDAWVELLARFADSGRFDRGLDRLPDGVELELRGRREG